MFRIKRVYQEPVDSDGLRVLVDRVWPRGISKDKAKVDVWLKEVAPSTELRKWFAHDPKKWEGFQQRYIQELKGNKDVVEQLRAQKKNHSTITLLYGARDTQYNQAIVLQSFLENKKG